MQSGLLQNVKYKFLFIFFSLYDLGMQLMCKNSCKNLKLAMVEKTEFNLSHDEFNFWKAASDCDAIKLKSEVNFSRIKNWIKLKKISLSISSEFYLSLPINMCLLYSISISLESRLIFCHLFLNLKTHNFSFHNFWTLLWKSNLLWWYDDWAYVMILQLWQ